MCADANDKKTAATALAQFQFSALGFHVHFHFCGASSSMQRLLLACSLYIPHPNL